MNHLLMIDNYDSFTYNLVHYFGELGADVTVRRNDEINLTDIEAMAPAYLCLSPGPGTPARAGILISLVRHFAGRIPILGVCLGHQAIACAFGGQLRAARQVLHGKTSRIDHDGQGLFAALPTPMTVTRYHSLAVDPDTLPDCLITNATASDSEIMALHHRTLPIYGVQFHPESILSEHGHALLKNFLENKESR